MKKNVVTNVLEENKREEEVVETKEKGRETKGM